MLFKNHPALIFGGWLILATFFIVVVIGLVVNEATEKIKEAVIATANEAVAKATTKHNNMVYRSREKGVCMFTLVENSPIVEDIGP